METSGLSSLTRSLTHGNLASYRRSHKKCLSCEQDARCAALVTEHLEEESRDRQAAVAAVRERLAALHQLQCEVGEGSSGDTERAAGQQLRALADCRCGGRPPRRGSVPGMAHGHTATWSGRAAPVSQLDASPVDYMSPELPHARMGPES